GDRRGQVVGQPRAVRLAQARAPERGRVAVERERGPGAEVARQAPGRRGAPATDAERAVDRRVVRVGRDTRGATEREGARRGQRERARERELLVGPRWELRASRPCEQDREAMLART